MDPWEEEQQAKTRSEAQATLSRMARLASLSTWSTSVCEVLRQFYANELVERLAAYAERAQKGETFDHQELLDYLCHSTALGSLVTHVLLVNRPPDGFPSAEEWLDQTQDKTGGMTVEWAARQLDILRKKPDTGSGQCFPPETPQG